jgi:hypothetical protein
MLLPELMILEWLTRRSEASLKKTTGNASLGREESPQKR